MAAGRSDAMNQRPPRVGFLMEQALGHVTYAQNLRAVFATSEGRIAPTWLPVPFADGGVLDRLPGTRSNWTVRGSARALAALRAGGGPAAFDALFFHTQTVALLSPLVARRTPVIVSLDATPRNFDRIGAAYRHEASPGSRRERLKAALHRRVLRQAAALTTWSQWAKDSLRDDYGVEPERVTVIPPGVDLSLFPFGAAPRRERTGRPLRVLFVGGDFERKGGPLLLRCMREGLAELCELHVVTGQAVETTPGVVVHSGLGPNDPKLIALYREADIFALPTNADCLAVVLGEAMAAGLPIVTTTVGGQPEAVRDGRSGLVIPPGDVEALGRALRRLILDAPLRKAMGREGRAIAEAAFDAATNTRRLTDVILTGMERWRRRQRRPLHEAVRAVTS
jgi:glycosyltransferase involved in cell wall biosynthesis